MATDQNEIELINNIKTNQRLREKFFVDKQPLVKHITYRFCGRHDPDFIQEGNLGLMRAIEKYDPSFNCRFDNYAKRWIFSFIQIFNNKNRVVRYGKKELVRRRQQGQPSIIPTTSVYEDTLGTDETLLDNLIASENLSALKGHLNNIKNPRTQDVIYRHFGINDRDEESYRSIAKDYSISSERVRQIVVSELDKIKSSLPNQS